MKLIGYLRCSCGACSGPVTLYVSASGQIDIGVEVPEGWTFLPLRGRDDLVHLDAFCPACNLGAGDNR